MYNCTCRHVRQSSYTVWEFPAHGTKSPIPLWHGSTNLPDKGNFQSFTVRHALPWPPNKLTSQVSQSGCVNFINGHASLQSPTGK